MTKAEELEMLLTRAEDSTISSMGPMVGDAMVAGWTRHNRDVVLRGLQLAEAVEALSDPKNSLVCAAIRVADHEVDEWHANRRPQYDCADQLPTSYIYYLQAEIRQLRAILKGKA